MSSNNNSEDCIHIKLLFFAKAREIAGVDTASFVCKRQIVVSELIHEISKHFKLEEINNFSFVLALNEVYCEDLAERLELRANDEIAIIPPVSGG